MNKIEAAMFFRDAVKARAGLRRLEARCQNDAELQALWADEGSSDGADCDVHFAKGMMRRGH